MVVTIRDENAVKLLADNERKSSREHQVVGFQWLLERDYGMLADEVGAGKTKQVIDASQVRYIRGDTDTMLVVTPGYARSTWAEPDPALGEVAMHAWQRVPNVIHEYHGNYTDLELDDTALHWVVTNYEFIRRDDRLAQLLKILKGREVWQVCDESWAIKGHSDQTRACAMLRNKRAKHITLLNGTPLSDGKPQDLYYPMQMLHTSILGVKNKAHFKSKYMIMDGNHRVVDYQNLDDLNARVAPHVLSRRTRDCWDLPPMLEPITVEVKLSKETWALYCQMRDDLVAWLGTESSVAKQAIVKTLRLAQICAGYLGGIEQVAAVQPGAFGPRPNWLPFGGPATPAPALAPNVGPVTREISREKLDGFLDWMRQQPAPDRMIVWCRFKRELERAATAMAEFYPQVEKLTGGQTPDERRAAKMLLAPSSVAKGAVVGNTKAGGASLNYAGASLMVFMSNGPALIERTQAIGRIERPGQQGPMRIVDVVATGPKGQKTVDHHIIKALRQKDDMARWTVDQWRTALTA